MENVFTWKWLRAALVRALKTVAQTATFLPVRFSICWAKFSACARFTS